jgi:hypothetical protein
MGDLSAPAILAVGIGIGSRSDRFRWRVLQEARQRSFTQAQLASPLARRPYDFRHAGVSWRLNAGTPAR